MAASQRSLAVTEAYRARLLQIRRRVETAAALRFPSIDELDDTDFPARMAGVMEAAQREAVRAGGGYLAAFVSSELGRRTVVATPDSRRYAGLSRDGRPLAESLQSPLIAVKAKLAQGAQPAEAIEAGRNRARRMAEMDLMHAARTSLKDGIETDAHTRGWQRAVRGTCGACLGAIAETNSVQGGDMEIHPGCLCISQPVVASVPDRFPLPTGTEILAGMSRGEVEAELGADTAAALAAGEVTLQELKKKTPMETQADFISQASI